jgi:hypothetical protein
MNVFLGGYPAGTAGTYTGNVLNWGVGDTTGQCTGWLSAYCGDLGFPSAKINRPSDIILLTEFGRDYANSRGYEQIRADYYFTPYWYGSADYYFNNIAGTYCSWGCTASGFENVLPEHQTFTKFLFADGHVKTAVVMASTTAVPSTSSLWYPSQGDLTTNAVLDTHWHASAP